MRRKYSNHLIVSLFALFIMLAGTFLTARAQTATAPFTSQELVSLLHQLPKRPDMRDEIINEIRRRGIGFALTAGFRSLVATKAATMRSCVGRWKRRSDAGSTLSLQLCRPKQKRRNF